MKHLTPDDMAEINRAFAMKARQFTEIVEEVANQTGVPWSKILSPSRKRPHARARHLVMFIAHREGQSASEIGRFLHRDHTSVIHGIRAEEKRRQS